MAVEKATTTKKATAEKKAAAADDLVSEVEALEREAAAAEGEEADEHDVLVVRDQRFRLVPAIPAITMMKLSAASDSKTPVPKQMEAIHDFLRRVIIEEDRQDFLNYLEDAEPVIDFEEINSILTDATEAISGNDSSQ